MSRLSKQKFDLFKRKKKDPFALDTAVVRLLAEPDLVVLEELVDKETRRLFGDVKCRELLDKSGNSLCLVSSGERLLGVVIFKDHPNVPSVPPWEWYHWLYNIYHMEMLNARNTVWIHLAAWDKEYASEFVKPILRRVFVETPYYEYVAMVVPPGIGRLDWLEGLGTRVLPSGFSEPRKVQTLYLMVRQHFLTKYKIRRAVEEDNDDLVPLIHTHSQRLQEYYGEFYVAELLTRHPDSGRKIIVAEYAEHAVSVLCLNESVNVDVLNESFELVPFYGLRKPDERDTLEQLELDYQASAVDLLRADREDQSEEVSITGLEASGEKGPSKSDSSIEVVGSSQLDVGGPLLRSLSSSASSEDDFSILNVSSIHLRIESLLEEDFASLSTKEEESDDFSAVILSFNDYEMHLFAGKSGRPTFSTDQIPIKERNQYVPSPHLPTYQGEVNAFTLELAASHAVHETESMTLLLEAAFECFPERDYCVLSVPTTCPFLPMLKWFVRVPPRRTSTYPQELYVLHRNNLLSAISVRIAAPPDLHEVQEMVSRMAKIDRFLVEFDAAVDETSTDEAFLLLSETQVIGVAVVGEQHDCGYLETHYEVNKWIEENYHGAEYHGTIRHLILAAPFQRQARFFLREIHRLSDFGVLDYRITASDATGAERERSLCCAMSDMIAIRPRSQPEYTQTNLEGWGPAEVVYRNDPPYALYLSNQRYLTLPKYETNAKIVVVGSSDTAIGFLDSLLCCTITAYKVVFNNVTVVSPHGLNYQKPENRIRDMMFVTRNGFNYRYMNLLSLRTYVNVVNAVMTAIDRKNKLLIVNDGTYLPYDYLFLLCGEQFQKPSAANAAANAAAHSQPKTRPPKKKLTDFPENLFLINTEIDATSALIKLKNLSWEHPKKDYMVVVYGNALEAYCCLATLLEYGIKGKNLTFVESFPVVSEGTNRHQVSHFNDADVDEAVAAAMAREQITVYSSYYFLDWTYDAELNRITGARFQSRYRQINVPCIAMFMYNEKTVSTRTFMAITEAGLVFDGGLVIKPDCRTNDPYIYAAGTLTKYSRRYYADHMCHRHFNLEEIGRKLGQRIREKLMPFDAEGKGADAIDCPRGSMLVPTYERPVMRYCRLPGNLRYLSVVRPGRPVPLEVAMASDDYGQVLVTGEAKQIDRQGFFRLHINPYGFVETITCLAQFDIDRKNLTSLWGKHEQLLNNLQLRFEMVLITDLFEYFREPWTCAIYHDRFPALEEDIKSILTSFTEVAGDSLLEDLIKMFKANDWTKLTLEQRDEIEEKFTDSPYHKLLEQKILDFLRDNDAFLPMYAHPMIVRFLLQGCENSPLFEPQ